MIIVLPQGDKGYWVDNANDGPRWGEYLSHDLVNIIDTSYRTLRTPDSRAIGGLSMGGYGALYQAFTHPDIFGVVGAHSPSLHRWDRAVILDKNLRQVMAYPAPGDFPPPGPPPGAPPDAPAGDNPPDSEAHPGRGPPTRV